MFFPNHEVQLPLSLNSIFSCLNSSNPVLKDIDNSDDVFLITPESPWNPHTDDCAANEANVLYFEGTMIDEKDQVKILLKEVVLDEALMASMTTCEVKSKQVDKIVESKIPVGKCDPDNVPACENIPIKFNDVVKNLCSVNGTHDAETMCSKLCEREGIELFKAWVGSCNMTDEECLLEEATVTTADLTDDKWSDNDDISFES